MKQTRTNPAIPILFEDNHLLVINKPEGVLSQGDHSENPDVLNLCKAYIKEEYDKPGKVFLGLVHRLDRNVGGVMALAKTSKSASRLSDQIRRRVFRKTYSAVVQGKTAKNGYLVHHLVKNNQTNTVKAYSKPVRNSKKAELTFQTRAHRSGFSLVEINLITGRPHQIRVQFSAEEHPLWGDVKYGSPQKGNTIALFASKLSFEHPTLKKKLVFKAPEPTGTPWNLFD